MPGRTLPPLPVLIFCLGLGALPDAARAQTPPPPPGSVWYLAEGASTAFFEEEILIANPNTTAADIEIAFLRPGGVPPVLERFTMAPTSRRTVRVNDVPGLANAPAVSAIVKATNGLPIVVERTMYWDHGTRRGGHNAPGVLAPAPRWLLAEGSTGNFDTFILIANPDTARRAHVQVTFLKQDGTTVPFPTFELAPSERTNIWVNVEVPGLANLPFSTVVESTNGVPVFVERAMYFGGYPWAGGHGSAGVTAPSRTWFFGEGFTVDRPDLAFDTFVLLANPNTVPADVTVEFLLEGGDPLVKTYRLLPTSRENIWVDLIPDRDGILGRAAFSIRIESTVPIVAERAMYWGPFGRWHEAHNTPGVTADALAWGFAEGVEDGVDASGLQFDSYYLVANPGDTPLALRATFLREDGTGIVRMFDVAPRSRFTIFTGDFPELSNQRFAAFLESTNGVRFVAERAVYWGAGYFGGTGSTGTPFSGTVATPPPPPLPQVTGIAPAVGFTTGGTRVTISGTNFRAGSTVTIGGAPAGEVTVLNATTIRAVTPARPAGPADVVVSAGDTVTTLPAGFTYEVLPQPEIFAISPNRGTTAGGTEVTIDGLNLGDVVDVRFGGVAATALRILSATRLVARTPARSTPATVDVTLRTAGQLETTAPAAFTYERTLATDSILAFGDSNTYGSTDCVLYGTLANLGAICGRDEAGGYPGRLQTRLRADYAPLAVTVTNGGVPGELADWGKDRLPTAMRPEHDLVIIMEGVNDLNAESDSDVNYRTIQESLRSMVRRAKSAGKAVFLGTLPPVLPVPFGDIIIERVPNYRIEELNRRIRIIAAEERVVLVDFWQSFTSHPDMAALFSADGLHPSRLGYERMAQRVRGHIIEEFDGKPPIVP